MYDTILVAQQAGICTITLNRPERLNAWTRQMGSELEAAISAANADATVLAMVLTGAGRGFCAGADIEAVFKAQADGEVELNPREPGRPGHWVDLVRSSKPLVAAINGAAIGVGLTQVLPMDYLVASDDAKLSLRFVKMGLVPELASSQFVFARVGFGNASELMLTGKTISGTDAARIGLVDLAVPKDAVLDEATAVARAMGENPPAAVRQIKALITRNANETDLDQVQTRELAALQQAYRSPEHAEAVAAFLEKRSPDFSRTSG